MKQPVNDYFGIYQVQVWSEQNLVMLKSGIKDSGDKCLIMQDGKINNGMQIQMADCVEAISMGDGRELWLIQTNGHITPYHDESKCMEASGGETMNGAKTQLWD
jgi:hypothetical protein